MFRDFRISELRTLLNCVTPSILCENLNSEACTCDYTLSIITQDSLKLEHLIIPYSYKTHGFKLFQAVIRFKTNDYYVLFLIIDLGSQNVS